MLNKREIITIALAALILAFAINLLQELASFIYIFFMVLIVLIINILSKKIASFYLDSEIEIKFWEVKRYWFKPSSYFKKPFPVGIFLPIITTFLTLGNFVWMASLIFDVRAKIYKAAKRHGLYSFSEMTESQIGLIATAGVLANLLFAVIGYLIGLPQFARLNIYLAFFNMIPLADLDGNKIFFGNIVLWSFLAAITLIALGYAFLLV